MKRWIPILFLPLWAGCSVFWTSQRDVREVEGEGETKVTTRVVSFTILSSRSDLANFKVQQTEKTQQANVGILSQQGATNVDVAVKLGR